MKEVEFKINLGSERMGLDDDTVIIHVTWFAKKHMVCIKQGGTLTINSGGLWCSVDDVEPEGK